MNTKALFNIAYGLYVLTAARNGKDNGCIVNTLVQQTSSPVTVSVTVNKQNLTHDMIMDTGLFNVSVIDTSAPFELFRHFGLQSGKNAEKLGVPEAYPFKPYYADNGLIYLKEFTNAYLSASVKQHLDLGSHTMFLADVTDCNILSDRASVTYSYYQKHIKPRPAPAVKKGFVCKVCGYIYEGDTLPEDFICPVCKHGAQDFEPIRKD